jgi:hypothetical protein
MTHEHHLELQQKKVREQYANESSIEYEYRLNKQNNYACKKYVEESLVLRKQ